MTSGGFDQRPRDDTHAGVNRLPLSERRDVLVFRTEPLEADLEVNRHDPGQALGFLDGS